MDTISPATLISGLAAAVALEVVLDLARRFRRKGVSPRLARAVSVLVAVAVAIATPQPGGVLPNVVLVLGSMTALHSLVLKPSRASGRLIGLLLPSRK